MTTKKTTPATTTTPTPEPATGPRALAKPEPCAWCSRPTRGRQDGEPACATGYGCAVRRRASATKKTAAVLALPARPKTPA